MAGDDTKFAVFVADCAEYGVTEQLTGRQAAVKKGQPARGTPTVPKTYTGTELLAMECPELEAAIPGLVVEGLTILGGRPKEGKSFMALDWCLGVAAGGHALGSIKVEGGEALYIGLEDSYRRIKKRIGARLQELKARDPTLADRFHCRTDWPSRPSKAGTTAVSTPATTRC
jgi:hypothetical protein